MTSASRIFFIFIVISLSLLSLLFSLSKGSTSGSLYQLLFWDNTATKTIILQLRLPRTLTAFTCGGLLALSGALMQLLLLNPLADPYVLGISGGAAFFTLLMMLVGANEMLLTGGAWLGSLLTILMIVIFASKHNWNPHRLLLSGIAFACGFSALISFILIISPDNHLHSMLFWLSGDLNNTQFPWLSIGILFFGLMICLFFSPGLNILGHGAKEAQALGLSYKKYRMMLYFLSALFTAQAVTLAGCIGFIGLIVPHITRMLCGYDHRLLLPAATLLGGSLLTIADTFARSLFSPEQIPVGIIMAILGIPIFVWLVQK